MTLSLDLVQPPGAGDNLRDTGRQLSPLQCNNISRPTMASLFIVPSDLHANATIFGMQTELELLDSGLNPVQKADRTSTVLVAGSPGAGKTYLARQYIWSHQEHYPDGVFWIDGSSSSSAQDAFDEIAQVLKKGYNVPEQADLTNASIQVVHDYLHLKKKWLLIFDGVPPLESDQDIDNFTTFFPVEVKHGSILYTSVDRTLTKNEKLHAPYLLQMPPLSIEDACKMIFHRLDIKRPTQMQVHKACMVARHYEGLPLAIYAVGKYLSSNEKPIERFSFNGRLTDAALVEPFLAVFERLHSKGYYTALDLLNILGFYNSPVQVDLLHFGEQALRKHGITSDDKGDSVDLALVVLSRYSLIDIEHGDDATGSGHATTFVHTSTALRSVCRDQQRAADFMNPDSNQFIAWLLLASEVLHTSYHNALAAFKDSTQDGSGVREFDDFTENYKLHISALTDLFPKKGHIAPQTSQTYGKLIAMNMCIDDDVCNCRLEPSTSEDSTSKSSSSETRENSGSDDDGLKIISSRQRGGPPESPLSVYRHPYMRRDSIHPSLRSQTLNTPSPSDSPRSHPSAFLPGELPSPSINRRRTDLSNTPRKGSVSSYFERRSL